MAQHDTANVIPPTVADIEISSNRARRERYFKSLLQSPKLALGHYLVVATVLVTILVLGVATQERTVVSDPQCESAASVGVNWRNCHHVGIDLSGRKLPRSELQSGDFSDANFAGADLKETNAAYAKFTNTDFRDANLQRANLVGSVLVRANLSGANLKSADLSFADLRGADLRSAELAGATLGNTIWVDGSVCAGQSVGMCLVPRL